MRKNSRYPLAVICLLVAGLGLGNATGLVGCGGKPPPKPAEPALTDTTADAGPVEVDAGPPAPKSLFERLGGKDGVEKLVDSLIKNVTTNPKLKKAFAKTKDAKLEAFKKNLNDQFCEMSGGPCKYAGKDMASAHAGMNINQGQWDAFVQALDAAMDENKVGEDEKNELMALFAPLREDILKSKKK
jgi:hemoglobin